MPAEGCVCWFVVRGGSVNIFITNTTHIAGSRGVIIYIFLNWFMQIGLMQKCAVDHVEW